MKVNGLAAFLLQHVQELPVSRTLPFKGTDMLVVHQEREERRGRLTAKHRTPRGRRRCWNPASWLGKPETRLSHLRGDPATASAGCWEEGGRDETRMAGSALVTSGSAEWFPGPPRAEGCPQEFPVRHICTKEM